MGYIMVPTSILKMARAYGLCPRLWLVIQLNYFQDFETKAVKAKYKIWKRKQTKALDTISVV